MKKIQLSVEFLVLFMTQVTQHTGQMLLFSLQVVLVKANSFDL